MLLETELAWSCQSPPCRFRLVVLCLLPCSNEGDWLLGWCPGLVVLDRCADGVCQITAPPLVLLSSCWRCPPACPSSGTPCVWEHLPVLMCAGWLDLNWKRNFMREASAFQSFWFYVSFNHLASSSTFSLPLGRSCRSRPALPIATEPTSILSLSQASALSTGSRACHDLHEDYCCCEVGVLADIGVFQIFIHIQVFLLHHSDKWSTRVCYNIHANVNFFKKRKGNR